MFDDWRTPKWARTLLANQERILAQLGAILNKENEMGDTVQNLAASVEANFAATKTQLTTIATGVTALDAKIVALQAQIASGLSAADQAALQALVADSAALAAQAKAIDTTPPAGS